MTEHIHDWYWPLETMPEGGYLVPAWMAVEHGLPSAANARCAVCDPPSKAHEEWVAGLHKFVSEHLAG